MARIQVVPWEFVLLGKLKRDDGGGGGRMIGATPASRDFFMVDIISLF